MKNYDNYKELKELEDLLNQLTEDLNFSYDIEWEKDNNDYVGYFLNNEIMFQFTDIGDDSWFYKFFRLDPETDMYTTELNITDLYNYEKKTNILGTIKNSIIEFIKTHNPKSVCFSSIDKSKARKNIYELFCEEIKNTFNYKYGVLNDVKNPYNHLFIIYSNVDNIKHIKGYFIKKYKITYGK